MDGPILAGKTWLAVLSMHLGAALSFFLGVVAVAFCFFITPIPRTENVLLGLTVLGVGVSLALVLEWIVSGLHRRRFWAWLVSVFVCVLFLPTPFLPIGILGLWGLSDVGTRREFGFRPREPKPPVPPAVGPLQPENSRPS